MGFWALLPLVVGCGDGANGAVTAASERGPLAPGGEPNSSGAQPPDTSGEGRARDVTSMDGEASRWVFDDRELRTYELTLDAATWADLQRNARDEQYAEAELRVDDVALSRVGLRFKGSVGTLGGCFDDSGRQTCSKLSMKLKLDEYDPAQRLDGLKRLNFHSMILDASQLRERLAYRIFAEMGVVSPRAAHARLVVNGELLGLFALVEEVDGRFTDDHFGAGDGDGNLYKEQWPNTDDPEALSASLETNEDTADHSALSRFSAELDGASRADLPAVVARYMDVDQLLTYLVVDRAIINWDGVTAFYCFDTPCENHNYYLYQHETEDVFTLIPWDLDNTFQLDSPLAAVPGPFAAPEDCDVRYMAFGRGVMAPACDPLLLGVALSGADRIALAFDRLLSGPLELSTMEGWLDTWQAQIEPAVAEDDNGPGLEDVRSAIDTLRANLVRVRERALAEREALAGSSP